MVILCIKKILLGSDVTSNLPRIEYDTYPLYRNVHINILIRIDVSSKSSFQIAIRRYISKTDTTVFVISSIVDIAWCIGISIREHNPNYNNLKRVHKIINFSFSLVTSEVGLHSFLLLKLSVLDMT